MSTRNKPIKPTNKPLCVVAIGYHVDLLLPMAEGLKLVQLLQQALVCNTLLSGVMDRKVVASNKPKVELRSVDAADVLIEVPEPSTPARGSAPALLPR